MFTVLTRFGILLAAISSLPVVGYSEDWAALFRELVSTDASVSDAAREKAFGSIIPRLVHEDAAELDGDVAGILAQSRSEGAIRLQVSALMATLAYSRLDGGSALVKGFPVWVDQLQNDPNERIRYNAAFALSSLKPDIPTVFAEPLIRALKDRDVRVVCAAILGIARLCDVTPEARRAIVGLLAAGGDNDTRRATIQAVGNAQVRDANVIKMLGENLRDKDRNIVKDSLQAIKLLGPAAIGDIKGELRTVANDTSDRELSDLAKAILSTASR